MDTKITNNRRLLLLLSSAAVLFGIIEGALGIPDTSPRILHYLELIAANAIIYNWFINDTENVNYYATPFLKFSIVAFGVFAVFYYFVKSRKFPGCLKSFWFCLLLFLVTAFIFTLTAMTADAILNHST